MNCMRYFEYGKKETDYLCSRDSELGKAIDKIGTIKRQIMPEPFSALVYSIIGQQISGKAAETVWNKLVTAIGKVTPENLGKTKLERIQGCGMSIRKSEYIKDIAQAVLSGVADFRGLEKMSDSDIINELTKFRGVGVWTAEMLLIFSLCRPDVVSYSDFGIRKGMMKLYGITELKKNQFDLLRERYSPYGTTASLYLWEIAAAEK